MGVFYSVHRWDLPGFNLAFYYLEWLFPWKLPFWPYKGEDLVLSKWMVWPGYLQNQYMYRCTLYARCMYAVCTDGYLPPTSTKEESSLQNVWKSIIQGISAWRREMEVGSEEHIRTEKKNQIKSNPPPAAGWTIHTETRTTTFRQTRQEKSLFKG